LAMFLQHCVVKEKEIVRHEQLEKVAEPKSSISYDSVGDNVLHQDNRR
jgi:hypothetical protein